MQLKTISKDIISVLLILCICFSTILTPIVAEASEININRRNKDTNLENKNNQEDTVINNENKHEKISEESTERFIVKYKEGKEKIGKEKITNAIKNDLKDIKEITKSEDVQNNEVANTKMNMKNLSTVVKAVIKFKRGKNKKLDLIITDKKMKQKDFLEKLKDHNEYIEYIQPDYEIKLQTNDTYFNNQWSLGGLEGNTDTDSNKSQSVDANVISAWEQSQGDGVVVGIIDTGIDINHEDLSENIWRNQEEIPNNGVDDDKNGYIDDVNGWNFYHDNNKVHKDNSISDENHGTHIAGIIASVKDNNKGIVGVSPKAKVMPLKVFHYGSAYTSDIIKAIEYAENMGVKIVNCSWAGDNENQILKEEMKESNLLFICAAGNDHKNIDVNPVYPAAYESKNIVSVAAIKQDGSLSDFSNHGEDTVDVAAPGDAIISTLPNNQYGNMSGTSMAVPFVAGEAALIFSKYKDMGAKDVRDKIITSSEKSSFLLGKVYEGNKVNCINAIDPTSINKIDPLLNEEENFEKVEITEADIENFKSFAEEEKLTKEKYEDVKSLFDKGYKINTIASAWIVAKALGLNTSEIIGAINEDDKDNKLKKRERFYSLTRKYNEVETYLIETLLDQYCIDIDKLILYKGKNKITWNEIHGKVRKEQIKRIKAIEKNKQSNIDNSIKNNEKLLKDGNVSNFATASSGSNGNERYYPKYINPAYNYRQNNNEKVIPNTGSLQYQRELFNLPGRNGLDLNIMLSYNSQRANLYHMSSFLSLWPNGMRENYGNQMYYTTYNEKQNNLGAGWALNIPSIERYTTEYYHEVVDGQGRRYYERRFKDIIYLHLEDGRAYRAFDDSADNAGYDYYISKYYLKDMELKKASGEFSNGETTSADVLVYKDGKKVYFDNNGKAIGVVDRQGNNICLFYKNIDGKHVISRIKDTLGREVNISYYQSGADKKVTFTGPDGLAINLEFQYLPQHSISNNNYNNEFVLKRIKDQKNRETMFDYSIKSGKFSFSTDYKDYWDDETNYFANLVKVTYPTEATSEYIYEKNKGRIGSSDTKYEYYRIKTREENVDGVSYNKETYEYEGDFTGNRIDGKYFTKVKNVENKEIKYAFNRSNLNVKKEIKRDNLLYRDIAYIYDKNRLLTNQSITINDYEENRLAEDEVRAYNYYTVNTLSKQKEWVYNDYGDLLKYVNENGQITNYQYENKFHQLKLEKQQIDKSTWKTTEYNINPTNGNINWIKQHHKENGVDKSILTRFPQYDTYGNIIKKQIQKQDGTVVEENYYYGPDEKGTDYKNAYLTKKTITTKDYQGKAQKIEEKYTYDFNTGRLSTYTNGKNQTVTHEYDNLGRKKKEINPDGSFKQINYDDTNNIVILTLENGHKIRAEYDGLGRLQFKKELREGTSNQWITLQENHYDFLSQLDYSKDTDGDKTSYQYDLLGRVERITNPDTTYRQIKYYDGLNKKEEINEEGEKHTSYYDHLGNLTKEEVKPTTSKSIVYTTNYLYDYLGNLTYMKDPKNNETNYHYDDLGRLIEVINAKGEKTICEYNNLNNITITKKQEYDKDGNLTRWIITEKEYDDIGRPIKSYAPYDQATGNKDKVALVAYDEVGNINRKIDREGQRVEYSYDNMNRVKTRVSFNKQGNIDTQTKYNYDQLYTKNKMTVTAPLLSITYEYYSNGNLKKATLPNDTNKYTLYEYYDDGNLEQITDPFGLVTKYTYDSSNRIDTLVVNGKVFDYHYYDDGMMQYLKYPILNNGQTLQTDYDYDNINRLDSIKSTIGTKEISKYEYRYDGNSNIRTIVGFDGDYEYNYDSLNRLKQLDRITFDKHLSFSYDARGNRTSASGDLDTLAIAVNEGDFIWDSLDSLKTFTEKNTKEQTSYSYNHEGIRTKKQTKDGTIQYFTDRSGRVIAEGDGKGNVKAQIIWGHKPLARIVDSKWYYYVYNGHGDVVQLVDENGKIVNRYSYDEWGNLLASYEGIENPIRYSGEYFDEETGLYYLRARYYDPVIGRFISEDSYEGSVTNPLSLNLYTYCYNNPLVYSDPTGHSPTLEEAKAFMAGFVYAIDEGFFFGKAQAINGVSAEDWRGSENEEAFFLAYNSGIKTNQIYGIVNVTKGARNIISSAGNVISNGSSLAISGVSDLSGVGNIAKGSVVYMNSNGKSVNTSSGHSKSKKSNSNLNIKKINDRYLKKNGIDAHKLKTEFVGKKNISRYDLYVDKNTGEIYIYRKNAVGEGLATGEFIK